MLAVRLQCPFCSKSLRLRQAPTPGRRLLCSGCQRSFLPAPGVPEGPEEKPAPAPAALGATPAPDWLLDAPRLAAPPKPAKAPPPPPAFTPSPVLQPVPPPRPRDVPDEAPPDPSRRMLLLGGIAGGLLLLVGTATLALVLAARHDRRKSAEPLARADDPPSTKAAPSTSIRDAQPPRDQQPPRQPPRVPRDEEPPPAWKGELKPPPLDPLRDVADVGKSSLPRELQDQVNAAIDKGVDYFKKKQLPSGSWESSHTVGMASLPALTLLECGVKADDPVIQKAARHVREFAPKLTTHSTTYETSLALLFLDRLGDPKDKALIQSLAARLVAGQLSGGGWTYSLPTLTAAEERELVRFLDRTRPERDLALVDRPKDKDKTNLPIRDGQSLDAIYEAREAKKNEKREGHLMDVDRPMAKREKSLTAEEAKKEAAKLSPKVRAVPAVVDAAGPDVKGRVRPPFLGGAGDNSNTQFATLALWAARRHDLPLERSLDAVGQRFRDSQLDDGTWRYHATKQPAQWGTPAMTGAGLLGLAVGHGSATDPDRSFKVKDAKIDKGLKALGKHVGKPLTDPKQAKGKFASRNEAVNLYFLWTVERVGVLYDVKELDGKDWYLWGVELLVPMQDREGAWHQPGAYPGAIRNVDTAFALLFLKRANLASDLTKRLEFVVDGKPGR